MLLLKPWLCCVSLLNLAVMRASAWVVVGNTASSRIMHTTLSKTWAGSKVHSAPTRVAGGVTTAVARTHVAGLGRRRCSALAMGKANAKDAEVALRSCVDHAPGQLELLSRRQGGAIEARKYRTAVRSFHANFIPEAFNGVAQAKVQAKENKPPPPLVFIHGSYHSAWCWAEHWMPFLAAKGYETYSISLRGTSGTLIPGAEPDAKGVKVKISDHVDDIRSFAETVLPGRRPVFVSHSFGGVVLLKFLEELATEGGQGEKENKDEEGADGIRPAVAGGAFLCSVPPSGNGPMTKRFIKQRPVMAVKIVLGFVLKMAVYWPWLARDLFFCQALEQSALKRYMSSFKADSKNGLDLMDFSGQLPMKMANANGQATWVNQAPPRLVIGAERDRIMDEAGVKEMATFLDTDYVMLPTVPHEVMLGPDWPLGVARLLQWLETTDFAMSSKP